MKDLSEINDDFTKISNFLAMTETGDREIARQYLLEANWDETLAVNNFFNKIRANINSNSNIRNSNNANSNNDSNGQGFFSKYILEPLKNLFSSCYNPREVDLDEENKIFQFLPNKIDDFEKFNKIIKKHLGIIIFYNGSNIEFLNKFISLICRNSSIMNLLKQNCAIYPILANFEKGIQIQNMITSYNFTYPAFVFCHNNTNNNTLNESNIINLLESEAITIELFNNKLIDSLEKINRNIKRLELDDKFNILTDGEILEKQKNDMMALEKQVQKNEEQKKIEQKKLTEIDLRAKDAKNKVGEEPMEGNQDSTTICFRYPDGEKRIERRFLKSDKIKNLYEYVTSLGREIYTEEEINTFSLYQPFPPRKYDNMENTLEKEGLFPNAIIQIREE